jgi:predicted MFS family arabinose efflux permease
VSPLARNVPKLYAIRFCFWLHTVSAVLVPFFTDWGGISLSGVLLLNAWFWGWNFVLEVPTGTVADRFGRRTSLALGTATGALATLVYVSAPRFEVFLLGEVLFALSLTLCSGADEALLYDSLDAAGEAHRAPRAIARAESMKLAGIVAGALLGSVLAVRYGVRWTFAAQALPMAAASALAWTLREAPVHRGPARPRYLDVLRGGLRHFAGHPALRALAFDLVSIGALAWLVIWLYQPLLRAAGVPLAAFGSVHVGLSLGQIAWLAQQGRLERALGSRRRVLVSMALAAGASFVGLGLVRAPFAVIALSIAAASFGLARTPLLTASMNPHIPSAQRATVLSVVSGLRTLGIMLGNALASAAVGVSLHGTALAIGVAIVVLALLSRARDEHFA